VAILPYIFKPFYSTKQRAMGLGLPGARYIVEKHRGSLTGQNRPGGGAHFTITMPLNPEK
jgi:signal transduction histidine kinase